MVRSMRKNRILASVAAALVLTAGISLPAEAASPTGHKNLTTTLTADNHIIADWDATSGVKYYNVKTSSTADMSQDVKTYKVAKSHTDYTIDATASRYAYAKPSSGNYVFVRIYAIKSNGKTGVSPYQAVRLNAPTTPTAAQQLTVATYNVRTAETDLKGHSWKSRISAVAARIKESNASVVAIQEAGDHPDTYKTIITQTASGKKKSRDYYWQFEQLRDAVNTVGGSYQLTDDQEYSLGSGKEGTRILYDDSKLTMLSQGNFAPSAVNTYLRYVPWALFQDKVTGEQFYFISAHLDNRKDKARSTTLYKLRLKQTTSIINKARTFAESGHQVVLAGDLNSNIYSVPTNGVDRKLSAAGFFDAYATANNVNEFKVTFNNFAKSKTSASRTDYIMTFGRSDLTGAYSYKNWTAKSKGVYASDHNLQSAVVPF